MRRWKGGREEGATTTQGKEGGTRSEPQSHGVLSFHSTMVNGRATQSRQRKEAQPKGSGGRQHHQKGGGDREKAPPPKKRRGRRSSPLLFVLKNNKKHRKRVEISWVN